MSAEDGPSGMKVAGVTAVAATTFKSNVPSLDCDVLMTFPPKATDVTILWLLERLKTRCPQLDIQIRHHSNTGCFGFYFTAKYDVLLQGAEDMALVKPVTSTYGGGTKEFVVEQSHHFEGVSDPDTFLTSQERQGIINDILCNMRATNDDRLGTIKFVEGQAIVPILESKKFIKQVLPLHNNDDLAALKKEWVAAFFKKQPLDKIERYFGVKVAMYFAYLGHYTRALIFPTVVGILFFLLGGRDQYRDDVLFVIFACINVVWSTLYLEHWKRRSAEFSYQWNTLDMPDELLAEPRPLFRGKLEKSRVTGRMEPAYPAWKRNLFRYCVSVPVILLCLLVVFFTMWTIFQIQDAINAQVKEGNLPKHMKFVPKIMLAVSIGVLDNTYKVIAYWLNDKENYRLQEDYDNQIILKIVLFQFVNSFLSLFYIAFYLQDSKRLKEQLAALLIVRQVVGNVKEALIPFVVSKIKLMRMEKKQAKEAAKAEEPKPAAAAAPTEDTSQPKKLGELQVERTGGAGKSLSQAEVESQMKTYEDTMEDYLEMLIQFGYVTLLSSAFPLAALCAFANNLIEIRTDAFKLCTSMQRPFGERANSIGIWQDGLELMSLIAVMVNCALIGMSDLSQRLFPNMTTAERVVWIVLMEHLILAVKIMMAYAIPDVPQWVAEEKAKLEFDRREAVKQLKAAPSKPKEE